MSKTITTPEVGRHVHYVPGTPGVALAEGRPHAAIITYVHSPTLVNLCVFDANGGTVPKTSVRLQQPGEAEPVVSFCRWMPYHLERKAELDSLDARL